MLPVSAEGSDETVLDGYHVDDVPYNSSFDSVLTVGDEYILYTSDEDKTYKSVSPQTVSDVSELDSVYSYKSVTQFIPTNIWRGSNSPSISFPVSSTGYTGVKYIWSSNDDSQSFYHYTSMKALSELRGGRKYRVTFTVSFSRSSGSFVFYLANRSSSDSPIINLFNVSRTINMSNSGKSVSIDFTLPDGSIDVIPVIKGTLYQSGNASYSSTELTFYVNDFTITDITTADLDSSLGKLGDRIKGFFDNLVESIKGFFIPKEGFFDDVKERFDKLLSEHLGFLYQAPAMVVKILQLFVNWNPPDTPYLDFPAFDFDIAGNHIHLWDSVHYTFDFLQNEPFSTFYSFYKTLVFCIISLAMINLAIKKYHSIIGGGSDDN